MARSNGKGQEFARASAQSSTIMDCFGQSLGFSRADANVETQACPEIVTVVCSCRAKG
jgi:hypothetical protein